MEKENKKTRDKAKKERNELVRQLVALFARGTEEYKLTENL